MFRGRVISLTIMIALIFSTFCLELQADEGLPYDIQILQAIGMLKGTEEGITVEYLKTDVKRWQVAIMLTRLTGTEVEAINYTGTDNFADANLVDPKTERYLAYLYAHPELGMSGIGNNKFDPNSNITAKDYYKVMLQVLGYKVDIDTDTVIGDFKYEDTLSFAKSKGLSKTALSNPFTVGDMATATIEALKANVRAETKSLLVKLIEKHVISPSFLPVYNSINI